MGKNEPVLLPATLFTPEGVADGEERVPEGVPEGVEVPAAGVDNCGSSFPKFGSIHV